MYMYHTYNPFVIWFSKPGICLLLTERDVYGRVVLTKSGHTAPTFLAIAHVDITCCLPRIYSLYGFGRQIRSVSAE